MCENGHYQFLKYEVEKLKAENEALNKERKELWAKAERAYRIQMKLQDLFDELTMIKEPLGGQ